MGVTAVKNVTNNFQDNILFINTEFSGNNREIASEQAQNVGNCWIPWCTQESSFPSKHLQIIDTSSEKVLWYIWQCAGPDGDHVRCSQNGFQPPAQSNQIPGTSEVDGSRNLVLDQEGNISAQVIATADVNADSVYQVA
jgi:hypothetical protein